MKIFKNPEHKGIVTITLGVLLLIGILSIMQGGLEKYLNLTWLSGPSLSGKIIFISDKAGSTDIYSMPENGGNAVKITDNAKVQGIPAIAPNSRKIVFLGEVAGSNSLYSIRADGRSLSQITEASGPKSNPIYTNDGKTLGYIASGKIYLADTTGSNPKTILPTHQEESAAISQGEGMPTYTNYAFENNGEGILASCETSPDVQVLTYLTKPDGESARIPLSPDAGERAIVTNIIVLKGTSAFIAGANVGSSFVLLYIDPKGSESRPIVRIQHAEGGRFAVSPDGSSVVVPMRINSAKQSNQLVKIPVSGGSIQVIARQRLENPCFDSSGSKILATLTDEDEINRDLVIVDPDTGNIKKLTEDGKSYNGVFAPASK